MLQPQPSSFSTSHTKWRFLTFFKADLNKAVKIVNGNRRNLGYKLASWNCNRALLKAGDCDSEKFTEIKLFIEKHKPHLFCVIESDLHGPKSNKNRVAKFTTNEIHEKLKVDGYSVVLPDTWEAHDQARLLVFVSDKVSAKKKEISATDNDLPTLSFKIGFGRERKTLVNFYYREWTSGITGDKSDAGQLHRFQRQVDIWRNLNDSNRDLVLLGDANFCYKSCNDPEYPSSLKNISNLATDFYLEEAFIQLVDTNTRTELKGNQVQKSCIDHIATSCPDKCGKVSVISAGNSDHMAIIVTKHSKEILDKPEVVKKRSYKNFSEADFIREVKYTDFKGYFRGT